MKGVRALGVTMLPGNGFHRVAMTMMPDGKRFLSETGNWRKWWGAMVVVTWILAGCQSLPQPGVSTDTRLVVVVVMIEDGIPTDEQRARRGSGSSWENVLVAPMPLYRDRHEAGDRGAEVCAHVFVSNRDVRRLVVILDDEGKAASCLIWHRI